MLELLEGRAIGVDLSSRVAPQARRELHVLTTGRPVQELFHESFAQVTFALRNQTFAVDFTAVICQAIAYQRRCQRYAAHPFCAPDRRRWTAHRHAARLTLSTSLYACCATHYR
jgi:hypothetical protein